MWKKHILGIVSPPFVLLGILLASSCGNFSANVSTPTATPILPDSEKCSSQLQTLAPFPFFIGSVFPVGSITRAEYLSGFDEPFVGRIYVKIIWSDYIDSTVVSSRNSNYRYEKVRRRVSLLVDGISIKEITFVLDELMPIGPFYVTWSPNLAIGLHTATIKIDTERGEILKYSWQFCIIDE